MHAFSCFVSLSLSHIYIHTPFLSLFLSVTDFNQIAANKQLFLAARVYGFFPRASRGTGAGVYEVTLTDGI